MDVTSLEGLLARQAIVDTVVRYANHLVTLAGDTATCVSAMLIHRLDPGAEPDGHFDTLGHYVHTLARTPEGWKITRVKQSVAWSRGNPAAHAGAKQSPRET